MPLDGARDAALGRDGGGRGDRAPRRRRRGGNLGLFRVGRCSRREASERRPAAADEGRRRRGRAALDRLRRMELRRRRDGRRRAARARCCPNGLTLERREVRGEISDGMILAEDEVGLGADHAGIMVLPETEPGTPLADVLPLVDAVLLVESTGNRARPAVDLRRRPRDRGPLRPAAPDMPGGTVARDTSSRADRSQIEIEDFDGCPRYIGRLFEGVAIGPSPVWLRARLYAAGHAADLERRRRDELRDARARQPAARVRLRRRCTAGGSSSAARAPGEKLRTLDGVERELVARRPADRRRRARDRARRDHGRRGDRDRRAARRPSCSRRRTSSRTASTAPPSASACAPRARTAGRRASTRTSPSRPPTSRPR